MTAGLSVRGLSFAYGPGRAAVFQDVWRDFQPGLVTAVTGLSGSGKSTLLYVLGLMLTPTAGSVLWHGEPVTHWSDADRSRLRAAHIGFVFQDAMLDPSRTAFSNVAEAGVIAGMSRRDIDRAAARLLERFGLGDRAGHRPGEVSGGQAQRIALCRALVKNPSVILADEPSGNLDDTSADVVWTALYEAAADGATVVVATHDGARADAAPEKLVIGV